MQPDRIAHEQAVDLIESWLQFRIQENTVAVLRAALSTRHRWQVSYWDAENVEAARAAGCSILLTEDLHEGMDFAGIRIVNPFRGGSGRARADLLPTRTIGEMR